MTTDAVARVMLATTAALLDGGRSIDKLSRLTTVAALAGLVAIGVIGAHEPVLTAALAFAILMGLIALYHGIRVGFDAAIFRHLADTAGDDASDFAALDEALSRMGLLAQAKTARPLEARIAGARRLLYRQAVCAVLQVLVILFGAIVATRW
jgi:hypothetical protein